MTNDPFIRVRGLAKTFRSGFLRRPKRALVGLDLTVGRGEIFGFLGPNGAGKTTTIKILLGLIRPCAGEGEVLGQPFGSVHARRELGFLPDAPNFYTYLTGRELLDFAGRLHGLGGADLRRRCEEMLVRVGLGEEAWDRRLKTYSRGMLQRVGIASALMHRPSLVILDEPLNGLDPLGRREFRDLLHALRGEGVTVFLSSHVLADVESTADRVGMIDRGRLVRCGSLEEILTGEERQVELTFELGPGPLLSELGLRLGSFRDAGRGWFGLAPDAEVASRDVARILEAGGRLLGMQPRRESLEECFLREISATIDLARIPPHERRRARDAEPLPPEKAPTRTGLPQKEVRP
jgi:ABC-2 type transport system ATP-binding protein